MNFETKTRQLLAESLVILSLYKEAKWSKLKLQYLISQLASTLRSPHGLRGLDLLSRLG